jgi:hypothetical protein
MTLPGESSTGVWTVSIVEDQARGHVVGVFSARDAALTCARRHHWQLVEGETICVEGFALDDPDVMPTEEWIQRPDLIGGERSLPPREQVIDG